MTDVSALPFADGTLGLFFWSAYYWYVLFRFRAVACTPSSLERKHLRLRENYPCTAGGGQYNVPIIGRGIHAIRYGRSIFREEVIQSEMIGPSQGEADIQSDSAVPSTGKAEIPSGKGITVIGDSVILGVASYLENMLPGIVIDGKVGRQMSQAQEVINQLRAQGKLGDSIIIELGTNGPFNKDKFRIFLQSLSGEKQIMIVNTRVPREWQDIVNANLSEVANEFSNVKMIDWYSASEGKDDYFYQDGVHLKPEGAKYFASLLVESVTNTRR
ncbi:hypothetical protein ACLMAB_11965 [Brevibacillus laterosporus]